MVFGNQRYPHNRQSIRIPGFDYSQPGSYYVTICAHQRERLFGSIRNGVMVLNEYGRVVADAWVHTSIVRPNIELGDWIIMPDHIHGIIQIVADENGNPDVGAMRRIAPTTEDIISNPIEINDPNTIQNPHGARPGSIGAIIGQIKSITAKRINAIRNTPGTHVWQRNYYEHIIRDSEDYERIQWYIRNNPSTWRDGGDKGPGNLA
jgi:REP element-mobilizing transposase RayT